QALSAPNSAEIVGLSDLVHEYAGYTSGHWVYTAWQYVPSDLVGQSYLILLNTYSDEGTDNNWSAQVWVNADAGVIASDFDGGTLPLITDEWVELRVEIDLDEADNLQRFYYGGDLLYEKSWTEGVSGGGALNIGAVDLFAAEASAVYYDDLSLQPAGVTAVTLGDFTSSHAPSRILPFVLAPLGLTLLAGMAIAWRRRR
ncbi:MAG: hypothetical protein ACRDIB_15895, partial [Ardenticatenaceae bacterium]